MPGNTEFLPLPEVILTLQTYVTGQVGNILIVSDGSKLNVVTEKVEKN